MCSGQLQPRGTGSGHSLDGDESDRVVHLHLECGVGRGIELRADIGGIDLINGVDTTVQSQGLKRKLRC